MYIIIYNNNVESATDMFSWMGEAMAGREGKMPQNYLRADPFLNNLNLFDLPV
jgi:hypothetical protein